MALSSPFFGALPEALSDEGELERVFYLFPRYYSFDVVEFVKCFERSKIVDIKIEDFITDLTQYRVVELEE